MTIIKTSSESLSPEELTEYMRMNIPVLITNFLTKIYYRLHFISSGLESKTTYQLKK
jgi:hypothetical protein